MQKIKKLHITLCSLNNIAVDVRILVLILVCERRLSTLAFSDNSFGQFVKRHSQSGADAPHGIHCQVGAAGFDAAHI